MGISSKLLSGVAPSYSTEREVNNMLHYPLLNMIYNSLKIRPKCMDWTIYRSSGTRTQSTVMSLQLGEVPLKAIILKMYLYTCLVMLCYVVFDTKSNLSHAALY